MEKKSSGSKRSKYFRRCKLQQKRRAFTNYRKQKRYKIQKRNFLSTCTHTFDTENHSAEIVSIHNGKLSNKDVNFDKCVDVGGEHFKKFHQK